MKLSKGIQFFAGSTQTTYDLTKLNLSAGNYAITVAAEAEGFTDSDVSNSVNYTVQAQLAAPTIAMNADGKTLEITDVENATSYDVYVDGTLKTNVAKVIPKYDVTVIGHKASAGASTSAAAIKADSDSVSYTDYTAYVEGRYSYEHETEPNIVGQSTFTASKVAMRGDADSTYKINNGATVHFSGTEAPVVIELTGDTTIDIGVEFEE